jgi:hypothetical protein
MTTQELHNELARLRSMPKDDYAHDLIQAEIQYLKDEIAYRQRERRYRTSQAAPCHMNGSHAAPCPKLY